MSAPDSHRISKLVAKSDPDPKRPRLTEEHEAKLYDSDRARAGCYAEMEHVTDKLRAIADTLADDDAAQSIPVAVEEEDSLVTSMEAVLAHVR